MISKILQHLDRLQVDLSVIDPSHDIEAADKVAAIASALRRAVGEVTTGVSRIGSSASEPGRQPVLKRDAA